MVRCEVIGERRGEIGRLEEIGVEIMIIYVLYLLREIVC